MISLLPIFAVDQIVKFRCDVVQRAAECAERCSAVHTASGLLLCFLLTQRSNELAKMRLTLSNRFVRLFEALKFHKSCYFSHGSPQVAE